jgi:tetratricopeptide (TPR) repeat protein
MSESGIKTAIAKRGDNWYLRDDSDPNREVEYPIYAREFSESPEYLYLFDYKHLLEEINTEGINYLVVTTGPLRILPSREMQLFRDDDLFELAFHRDFDGFALDIYKINPGKHDESMDYPVQLEYNSLMTWRDRTSEDDAPYSADVLVGLLGQQGILIDFESTEAEQAASLYRWLGDVFVELGNPELAAFEYRMMLLLAPRYAPQMLQLAQAMIKQQPELAAAWVLLGTSHQLMDQTELAQRAYARATEVYAEQNETWAAAYRGLGLLYASAREYENAVQAFEKALELSTFDAHNAYQELWFARGRLLQADGDIEQALAAYRRSLHTDEIDQNELLPEVAYLPYLDIVKQHNADYTSSEGREIRPDVFIVENRPYSVLFAHPPTEVSYEIEVPPEAILRFTPILAPEVWQLGRGDGVQFDVSVRDSEHVETIYSHYLDPKNVPAQRGWNPSEIDLSSWAGRTITLTMSTGPGPNDDYRFDWAAWGEPQILQEVARNLSLNPPATGEPTSKSP